MNHLLVAGGMLGALILLVLLVGKLMDWATMFKYDKHNPARRYCKMCGQQQNQYTRGGPGDTWWEAVGRILQPKCECHKHQEYRR